MTGEPKAERRISRLGLLFDFILAIAIFFMGYAVGHKTGRAEGMLATLSTFADAAASEPVTW